MGVYIIENDQLVVRIDSKGAELTSIKDVKTNIEYLWNGDEKYWGRRSPILFPIVGSLKNKEFTYNGMKYTLPQHGFARDLEFEKIIQNENEIWFQLSSTEETKANYPFDFILNVGYILEDRKVVVKWKVENSGKERLPFSIGGHPGFMCPIIAGTEQTDYYIVTDACKSFSSSVINDMGLVSNGKYNEFCIDEDGAMKITKNLFDNDALVIDNNQVNMVALAGPDKVPYVTVRFDMPLCGIWSPMKKSAPFICIEPWCGRCDADIFEGDIFQREYGNILESGKVLEKSYSIEFGIV